MSQFPPQFSLDQITDETVRENFRLLEQYLASQVFPGFSHFTVDFPVAESNHKFQHKLGFLPLDIILSAKSTDIVVTFDQDKSTADEVDITVSGPCTIRFLLGTFRDDT